MNDISGFGLTLQVVASSTFPVGFNVTQFADDADPFDLADMTIGETAMGLNGDLITFSTANPIAISVNVVPNSDDDRNLSVLFEANRVARGKQSARDVITMTGIYPDGRLVTFTEGVLVMGNPALSVASAGRMKSKKYDFVFENKNENLGV